MSSFGEEEIMNVVLEIIRNRPGIRTSDIIAEARRIMKPSGADLVILEKRSDDKFSQKVRNIKSHGSLKHLVRTSDERNCRWFLKETVEV